MSGTYRVFLNKRVFEEYAKRLRKIVEIALSENIEDLPPRLPPKLEHRCDACPYKGQCLTLPNKYRTYSKFFEAMGFEKLVEKKPKNTLDKFFQVY